MNQCNWYFINLVVDVFMGTFLNIMAFKQIEILLSDSPKYRFQSGKYSKEGYFWSWCYQCSIWLLVNLTVKIFIILILFFNVEFFSFFTSWVLAPFQISPRAELVYIMIVFPAVLNGISFWITDNYLQMEESKESSEDLDCLVRESRCTEKRLHKMFTA